MVKRSVIAVIIILTIIASVAIYNLYFVPKPKLEVDLEFVNDSLVIINRSDINPKWVMLWFYPLGEGKNYFMDSAKWNFGDTLYTPYNRSFFSNDSIIRAMTISSEGRTSDLFVLEDEHMEVSKIDAKEIIKIHILKDILK